MEQIGAAVGAQLARGIAEQVVQRVQSRVSHPAARTLRAVGVNQYAATISGSRGGPGIIRPIRAKALRFPGRGGGIVFAKSVNGAGLLPLIVAEGERISNDDAAQIVQRIKI